MYSTLLIHFRKSFLVRFVLITVVMASLIGIVGITPSSMPVVKAQSTTFRNPLNSSSPDPWMTYYNGNYYLMATTWGQTASVGLTMRRGRTIAELKAASPVRIWQDSNSSRCCQMWAPEFHLLSGPNGNRWYIYYTAGTSGACCDNQRLHVLESAGTDPMGPYTYRSQLFSGWAIDGSILRMGSTNYILYSRWEGPDQGVYIAQLSNPWTVTGGSTRLTAPTYSWETQGGRTNEAPVVLQRNGRTFLIFSASSCNTPDYKLGMLTYTGTNPLSASSWTKRSTPVFQRNDAAGVYGPGHNGFFKSPDGTEDWIVYHANSSTSQGCGMERTARIQKINWNSDGTPNFGVPLSTSTNITVPRGEVSSPLPTNTPGGSFPAAGTYYRLINRNSGKVADVANCATTDGTDIRQWASLGNACQQWSFVSVGSGFYKIVNRNSGKLMEVSNASTADGGNVLQWTDNGGTNQQWSLTSLGGGYYRIINRNSGKDLDVANCSTADGGDIRQWTWLNNNCQQWQITP